MPWRALGGYLALAAVGLVLVLRLPGAGSVAAFAAGGPAASAQPGPRLAVGDLLAWLATGSANGPFALLRTVLPGIGLPVAPATPATPASAASTAQGSTAPAPVSSTAPAPAVPGAAPRATRPSPLQLPDPPGNLHQTIHHPLPSDTPPPGNLVVYGVDPLVLIYQTDPTATAVGQRLAADLFAGYGIPVAQLRTAFTGLDPYLAAQARVQALMRQYPTLHILLDVHADAPPATAIVAGRPAAPVMLVVGDNQTLPDPGWRRNAAWAVQVAAAIERTYPGLLRSYLGAPFYTDGGRFDQQLSPAALLLEIGGRGEPARLEMRGADLLAEVLGPMIRAGQYPH